MTNEDKILQILSGMSNKLENIEQRLTGVEQEVAKTSERLTGVEQEVAKTNLMIENDVVKRLNLLTDGYILTHEKQYELERKFENKIEALEKRIELLEIKAG